jgi:hypothetical protein
MQDIDALDRTFADHWEQGVVPGSMVFDKRVTGPLSKLQHTVFVETGEVLETERVSAIVENGWLPRLTYQADQSPEPGMPMYGPARVGFYLQLERMGYAPEELRMLAEYEEGYIDHCVAASELAYVDDPVVECIRHIEEELREVREAAAALHGEPSSTPNFDWALALAAAFGVEGAGDIGRVRAGLMHEAQERVDHLDYLRNLDAEHLSEDQRFAIERNAFLIRVHNDTIRMWLITNDRAQIVAGYSPMLMFEHRGRDVERGHYFEGIVWEWSIGTAWVGENADAVTLRVPGFKLQGDLITQTETMPPAQYTDRWKTHRLDQYLTVRARLNGERACLHCHAPLPADADSRRRFCDDTCRAASRSRRYRERNPEQVKLSRNRWYHR